MNRNDLINIGTIGAVATAILWMFSTFATAKEVSDIRLDIAYGQYYDRLDDYEEELAEGDTESAEELKRRMERIKAFICEEDPKWERCEN